MFLCRLFTSVHRRKVQAAEAQRLNRVSQDPIPTSELVKEYRKRRRNKGLHYEFKAIEVISAGDNQSASIRSKGQHKVADIARLEENRGKNLSERVLPYERNIVLLDNGRYINASWVDGYNQPKKYIAAQGPLSNTKDDFWYMIWQHNCHCIVMATNLFEHARQQCDKYWHNTHARFGDIDVWLDNVYSTAEYETRVFRICKTNQQQMPRYVRQYQFKNWSQHDPPLPSAMIEIRRKVHDWVAGKTEPIVVHCSDGAGRTGTYICIDAELSRVEADRPVDILRQTLALRKARPGLVGNLCQYRLVYETVCAYVTCRQTSVRVFQFVRRARGLAKRETVPGSRTTAGRSGFEAEFESLAALARPLSVGDCAGGHRAENRWKSRDVMVQPPERARPYLLTQDSGSGTDFVNAVYVDGHCRANQYIVTQWPLRNTVGDFWKLIRDHHVSVVAVLSEFTGKTGRSYPSFWPSEKGQPTSFGAVSVVLQDEFDWSNCVRVQLCNLIKTTNARVQPTAAAAVAVSDSYRQARPLFLLYLKSCWQRGRRSPSANHGLLELACIAELANQKVSGVNPILVVSDNGVSRCGVFCVLHMSMDKMRYEGEIDIFRAVEKVRRNRPQLIDNLIEYQLCYSVLQLLVEYFFAGRVEILEDQTMRLVDLNNFPVSDNGK